MKIKKKKFYFSCLLFLTGTAYTGSHKVDGKYYVFNSKARLSTGKKKHFLDVAGYTYYVNKDGTPNIGWFQVSGKLYYANKYGRIQKNKTVSGIKLSKSGTAKKSDARTLKLKCMNILSSVTNSRMSKSQKLYAAWRYVIRNTAYSSAYYPNLASSTWCRDTALNTFIRHRGNCYGYACAFAALAKEIGYSDVRVVAGYVPGTRDGGYWTRHSWVIINGRHYDPEAQAAGWFGGIYARSGYPVYPHRIAKTVQFKFG